MRVINYCIVLLTFIVSTSTSAEALPNQPSISVTGIASLAVMPDQVTIKFRAQALEKDAKEAKMKVDSQVEALLANLKAAGFDTALLQRADLYSGEEYQYDDRKRTLVGIRAIRDLSYLLTNIDGLNRFLDTVLSSQIESINALEYSLASPEQWRAKIRQMAIEDSLMKAEVLATAYGAKLGQIYSINYQNNYVQPMMMMKSMQDEQAEATYQSKKMTLTDRVQAVFLLNP
ncbi:SIMPL domain-containing protein [Psychromonas sp. MME2]|uniref:SIMPL domain-containing protein n=1 Tax=unclassified Psychromonas TaxID=2614957 RepID=UPI00339D2DE8